MQDLRNRNFRVLLYKRKFDHDFENITTKIISALDGGLSSNSLPFASASIIDIVVIFIPFLLYIQRYTVLEQLV